MRPRSRLLPLASILALVLSGAALAQSRTYVESGGLVIVELERAEGSLGSWRVDTAIAGYTGDGYLFYNGSNQFGIPGRSPLRFLVRFTRTGTYRVQWRSRIAVGSDNTEHNDSWLKFPDADDFYAQRGSSVVYPWGSGRTPNPEGSGAFGWFKVYQNTVGEWAWRTATSDNDPHDIYVRIDTPAVYTVQISGRSHGHAIDRLVLSHSDLDAQAAQDPNLPESETEASSGTEAAPIRGELKLSPNPASGRVRVVLPQAAPVDVRAAWLTDSAGRRTALVTPGRATAGTLSLELPVLTPGPYVLYLLTARGAFAEPLVVGSAER